MAIEYTIKKHAVCFPTKMLASKAGKHIYNLVVEGSAIDNGMVVAKNEWKGLDLYNYKASTGVTGVIREQASNGNWYVEVTDAKDGILIRQTPMIEEQYNHAFADDANFFNAVGDVVRGYELANGDIIELSADAFMTNTPEAGKTLTIDTSSHKWIVAGE